MYKVRLAWARLLARVGVITPFARRHNERALDNQARAEAERQANIRAWLRLGRKE
jgi:hypothetical protein